MKVRIKENALDIYIRNHTGYFGEYDGSSYWEDIIEKISGKELPVNTDVLFKEEFNLYPIPGVTKREIRIFDDIVDKIIDDERKGKAYCDFCNEVSNCVHKCTNCGREDYLEPFFEEDTY